MGPDGEGRLGEVARGAEADEEVTGRLVEEEGDRPGTVHLLVARSVVGRDPWNIVPLLDDASSRQHAAIEFDPALRLHRISDLDSPTGTFVGEERIESDRVLAPGERIRIGRTVLSYEGPVGGRPQVEPPAPRQAQTRYVYRPNPGVPGPGRSPRQGGKVVCPHCWHEFAVEDTLFVARHRDLFGDPVVGPDAPQRFLPSRFTPPGNALDPMGVETADRACPRCHLEIPRALHDAPPFFLSIAGAPASGKSYFLTSMVWELRRLLDEEFHLTFQDADPRINQWLNAYEETLFLSPEPERPVYLRKTEMQGDVYDPVTIDGMPVLLPKPSIFTLRPQERHARARMGRRDLARNVVLYDNAGEHFQPGMDTSATPGTQHLVRSQAILFLFDPTRDPRFARRIGRSEGEEPGPRSPRQDVLLTEMIARIARLRGLASGERTDTPLVVVATKSDVWRSLLPGGLDEHPIRRSHTLGVSALDVDAAATAALAVRQLLRETCPEIVQAAEGFSRQVFYVPVTALGHAPARGEDGAYAVRPADIHPTGVAIPFLHVLAQLGLLAVAETDPEAGVPAAQVDAVGDQMRVRVAQAGIDLLLPRSFAGRVLGCPATGTRFRIPALTS